MRNCAARRAAAPGFKKVAESRETFSETVIPV
jgi:hypothetical protein